MWSGFREPAWFFDGFGLYWTLLSFFCFHFKFSPSEPKNKFLEPRDQSLFSLFCSVLSLFCEDADLPPQVSCLPFLQNILLSTWGFCRGFFLRIVTAQSVQIKMLEFLHNMITGTTNRPCLCVWVLWKSMSLNDSVCIYLLCLVLSTVGNMLKLFLMISVWITL